MSSTSDIIKHYQRSIEKSHHDQKRTLHCLEKLDNLNIKVKHLEDTGIGKTVNSLRKFEGEIGFAAKALISKWKNQVIQSSSGYSDNEGKDFEVGSVENHIDLSSTTKSENKRNVSKTSSDVKSGKEFKKEKDQVHRSEEMNVLFTSNNNNHKDICNNPNSKRARVEELASSSEQSRSESLNKEKNMKSSRGDKRRPSGSPSKFKRKRPISEEEEEIPKVEPKDNGMDSTMGKSFEDALGMISYSKKHKQSKTRKSEELSSTQNIHKKNKTDTRKPETSTSYNKPLSLLEPTAKLEPLEPNLNLNLQPTIGISTNYKPIHIHSGVMDFIYGTDHNPKRHMSEEEALSHGISSKTMRTKVYSGAKIGMKHQVPSLYNICIRILQKNIDNLEYTGGVPFEILKPVLILASPQQLELFEEYNPYLMEESDALWEQHCKRHYRGHSRQEMETWREMFFRCKEEQEYKLKHLTKNIRKSQLEIALPVKKTQLAYVDTMVKAPRNIAKKQEQYGTKNKIVSTPAARVAALSSITPNAVKAGDNRLRIAPGLRDTAQASSSKQKKAPLMAKMISMMKSKFRR